MLAIIILIKTTQASRVRGATLVASAGKESTCNAGDSGLIPESGRSPGEGKGYPLQYIWAYLVTAGEESACNSGDTGLIPGSGRSPGEGNGSPLQYSCRENSMDRGAWQATVHGVQRVGHY